MYSLLAPPTHMERSFWLETKIYSIHVIDLYTINNKPVEISSKSDGKIYVR